MSQSEQKTLDSLLGLKETPRLPDLLSEQALVNLGLSPARPEGKNRLTFPSFLFMSGMLIRLFVYRYCRDDLQHQDADGHI